MNNTFKTRAQKQGTRNSNITEIRETPRRTQQEYDAYERNIKLIAARESDYIEKETKNQEFIQAIIRTPLAVFWLTFLGAIALTAFGNYINLTAERYNTGHLVMINFIGILFAIISGFGVIAKRQINEKLEELGIN